jgi:hypothetical protein
MENEVFGHLLEIFNSANYRFLSIEEITRLLQRKGLYQDVEFRKAAADIWDHLNRPTADYPFCWVERSNQTLWGLERWLPSKKRRNARQGKINIQLSSRLQVGWELHHTISMDEHEITGGTFPLRGHYADSFIASMDDKQREYSIIELHCYGSEKLICAIVHDERENWFLEGMTLQRWYKENGLRAGDKVWLAVERINPLILRAYTEWDRDPDTYRRYEQRRHIEALPSIDLSIRDLIWVYLKHTAKIAHRTEIAKAILEERPEISERSVDGCLGGNPHLFVSIGERGYWGLKEWGMGPTKSDIHPERSKIGTSETHGPLSATEVPIDYILANIAAEDLVYRIVTNAKDSLDVTQITERIANYLGIDKNVLTRATFFDASDERLIRLQDGSFTLREHVKEDPTQEKTREQPQVDALSEDIQELIDDRVEVPRQTIKSKKIWPNRRMAARCQGLFAVLADHPAPS